MALKTETNTPEMEARIKAAFAVSDAAISKNICADSSYQFDFEHGQWWVMDRITGAQWSVVDAEGSGSIDGFGFERVTEGEEP